MSAVLKVANGRVKEIRLEKSEIVLSYFHPVSRREEELVFEVDGRTGFTRETRLEELKKGMPVTVDYEEVGGKNRAVRVSVVPMRGVPFEKNPLLG